MTSDQFNNRIRVTAATSGTFYGVPMKAGDKYTVAGNGQEGHAGVGGPARKAKLNNPQGVTTDHAGNILLISGSRLLLVAAATGSFYGQKMTTGHIYRLAGTGLGQDIGNGIPATEASLDSNGQVTVDHFGNVILSCSSEIRMVAARSGTYYGVAVKAGDIYTIAGNGSMKFSGDGGPPLNAGVQPFALAVDQAGDVLLINGTRVRAIPARSGTLYGVPVTAGDIYTIAGTGQVGYSGDGGPALKAPMDPTGLALDSAGNLYLVDQLSFRLRRVSF